MKFVKTDFKDLVIVKHNIIEDEEASSKKSSKKINLKLSLIKN